MENGHGNGKDPFLNIAYTVALVDQRQFQFTTFVSRDCDKQQLDDVLDKLVKAGDRQRAYTNKKDFIERMEREEIMLAKAESMLATAMAQEKADWERRGKRGEYMPTAKDRKELNQLTSSMDAGRAAIKKYRDQIEECDRLIGVG